MIKFTYKKIIKELDSPSNELLHAVIDEVGDDATIENIMNIVFSHINKKYHIEMSDSQAVRAREYMDKITNIFMSEPFEMRADLGIDAEEFVLLH